VRREGTEPTLGREVAEGVEGEDDVLVRAGAARVVAAVAED